MLLIAWDIKKIVIRGLCLLPDTVQLTVFAY